MIKDGNNDSSLVEIGKIVKAQGLDGKLKVKVYSGEPELLGSLKDIFLGPIVAIQSFRLISSRSQGKFAIISLAEIVDRNSSESLVGQSVWALKVHLPPLSTDEFYWHEIVGLSVQTDQGQHLGRVTSLIATGAHDVMVVTGCTDEEYLIPVIREIIISQDKEAGVLVIAPPSGLLEMNAPDAI